MRNVIVTGGSRGLGLGMARGLAASGFSVIAIARSRTHEIDEAAQEAVAAGTGAIHFLPFDFANLDDIPALFATLREQHGPIYGLVNNAGIGTEGVLATMDVSKIEALVRINTIAPLVVTKHAVRSMMSAGNGRIVNISSIIASTGYSGLSVYAATKASLIGFTKSLAREVGTLGITVNAVAPGFVETSMTGGMDEAHRATIARRSALRRLPDVDDVVHAVDYLMSERARNVTGTVLTVDAGNTA
ncbi:MAG: SDR family NAD(P)-dependent oxidoreductase [Beijerinckiaceae bacterium]|nr:SDR family NAD(P)-dependent oxidoreductase [Beijerinckiaceae bacterium]